MSKTETLLDMLDMAHLQTEDALALADQYKDRWLRSNGRIARYQTALTLVIFGWIITVAVML